MLYNIRKYPPFLSVSCYLFLIRIILGVGLIPVSFRMTDPNKDLGDRLASRWVIYRRVTKQGGTKHIITSCVWKHGGVHYLVNSLKITFLTIS